ncbi:adenylyl-sulfate kinase [Sulfobacillus harzensis]|uniref:adenylyl-sulfate kinase n=1 Tax=Sulfobacillus harzensis TaxID=2729629 RepID=A0A7Y0Q0P5_9FIRM|nr:adenylyl-sulfate kinase [Sulfobacillus harzensis]NMP21258.1 adenylyl-sulfate kinase [Sulfobacillus harzensis]
MSEHVWVLTAEQRCDLDLLLVGAFAPLDGFLTAGDYRAVLEHMHLESGELWPVPVVLDVPESFAKEVQPGDDVILCRDDGTPLAALLAGDIYPVDLEEEARLVYGTTNRAHAGVAALMRRHPWYIGGPVRALDLERLELARQVDFLPLYRKPHELIKRFQRLGKPVVAFHTRNAMHGGHYALTKAAQDKVGGHLLLHPTTGPTKPGDLPAAVRLRAIWSLTQSYPDNPDGTPSVTLATLPLAMRMAGPREAVWHALIRQNFGVDYFIVGRAPADPGKNPDRPDGFWYPPFQAQELLSELAPEMRIQPLVFPEYAWDETRRAYLPVTGPDAGMKQLSGTRVRQMLAERKDLPEWYAPSAVREVLHQSYGRNRGAAIFLTGLPAPGKSTLAKALYHVLTLRNERPVTLLDGDVIRRHLSKGLGFSPEDRLENMERVGFVSSLVVRNGGLVVIAMVAPMEEGRARIRAQVEPYGEFLEVYVATPLIECERRDPKGLYRRARSGDINDMTGIQAPYEVPPNPDLTIVSGAQPFYDDLAALLGFLEQRGIVDPVESELLAAVARE